MMRSSEGARLKTYSSERLLSIEQAVNRIAERAPSRLIEQHAIGWAGGRSSRVESS